MITRGDNKYIIMNKYNEMFLDENDGEVFNPSKAKLYDTYEEAYDDYDKIDVKYQYTVAEIIINYVINEI